MYGQVSTIHEYGGVAMVADPEPELSGSISRSRRHTSRSVRSEVCVLSPQGHAFTLVDLQARVWEALDTPCDLNGLVARINQPRRSGPVSTVTDARPREVLTANEQRHINAGRARATVDIDAQAVADTVQALVSLGLLAITGR